MPRVWEPESMDRSYEINPYTTITGAAIVADSLFLPQDRNPFVSGAMVTPVRDNPINFGPGDYHQLLANPNCGYIDD